MEIGRLFPRAAAGHAAAWRAQSVRLFARAELSGERLAVFLAQVGHETDGLSRLEERLGYSAARLVQVWPGRFPDLAAAADCAHAPERLACRVYADRMGNGDEASGDGWRFRGRGYLQLTGRDGYRAVGAATGLPLEADPARAAVPAHALAVACATWSWKRLGPACDAGGLEAVTRRLNGGTTGLAERRRWLARVRRTLAAGA